MNISVHILAGNCAHTIERCLNSVKDIAHEIVIVVDTRHKNSNAETYNVICKWEQKNKYTLKVYFYDWANDSFADARNFAISKQSGDWIICLDADEEIQNFEMPDNNFDYYLSTISKDDCVFRNIRMFKNGIGIKYIGKRHNQIENPIDKSRIGYNNILFYGFTTMTDAEIITKTNGLLKCHLEQLTEEPDNKTVHFNITRCYYGLKNWELCKEFAYMALQDPIETPHRAQVLIYLALSYHYTGRAYAANYWLNMSVNILPEQLWGWCLLYEKFYREGNFAEAKQVKDIILNTTVSYLPTDMTVQQTEDLFNKFKIQENESKTECAVHC